MQLKALPKAATAAKLSLTAVALTIAFSTAASAATAQVDFSFSDVTGFFTFEDGIGDTTADAFSITSNIFGAINTASWRLSDNRFEWDGDTVTSESSAYATGDESLFSLNLSIFRRGDDTFGEIRCNGLIDPEPCPFFTLSGNVSFSTQTTPVPLPAGLPMLIAGLGGLAGLRLRKGRRTLA